MKNLFFVSVAILILSATTNTVKAQKYFNFQNSFTTSTDAAPVQPSEQLQSIQYTTPAATQAKQGSSIPNKMLMFTEECKRMHFKFAQLLNREVESLTNNSLFNFLNDWWSTRYRYGGTTHSGIDCSAFVGLLINTVYSFKLPRTAREQYAATKRIALKDMIEGDLVFFNTTGGISHVGVYLGGGFFTHSSCSQGVTISSLTDGYYKSRYIGGGRIANTAPQVY